MGNPPDVDLPAPGKALLTSAVGSLQLPDVSLLSASPQQISHMCPVLPLGTETSAGVGSSGCGHWKRWEPFKMVMKK